MIVASNQAIGTIPEPGRSNGLCRQAVHAEAIRCYQYCRRLPRLPVAPE